MVDDSTVCSRPRSSGTATSTPPWAPTTIGSIERSGPTINCAVVLQDDRVEIYLLQVQGQPAGFAELDRRTATEVELAYFGLFPAFIGRGLGKYFLEWTIRQAWTGDTQRVWVHTCDLDHPAALPNYLRAGFQVYDEKTILQEIPDATSRDTAGNVTRSASNDLPKKAFPE